MQLNQNLFYLEIIIKISNSELILTLIIIFLGIILCLVICKAIFNFCINYHKKNRYYKLNVLIINTSIRYKQTLLEQ